MQRTKNIRKNKQETRKPTAADDGVKRLKLLITVVARNKTEFYMDFLSQFEINLQTAVLGQGTAKSETLYMLGLEDSDKGVIFSAVREDKSHEVLAALEEKFHTIKNGKGIAFTLPMSSVIGVATYRFLSNHRA